MNKIFIFIAFAAFTLIACSEDKSSSKNCTRYMTEGITKECLVGRWLLKDVEGGGSKCKPDPNSIGLKLEKNGDFYFKGGYDNLYNMDTFGSWELNEEGTTIKIKCILGCRLDAPDEIDATIEIRDYYLRITSSSGYSSFLQCGVGNFTEIFDWDGEK